MKSRYSNKYNAFIDSLYIEELCDSNNIIQLIECSNQFGHMPNFYAYANNKKIDTTFLLYIDIDNENEVDKAIELIDMMTL